MRSRHLHGFFLLALAGCWSAGLVGCRAKPAASPIRLLTASATAELLHELATDFQSKTGVPVEVVPRATGRLRPELATDPNFDLLIADERGVLRSLLADRRVDGEGRLWLRSALALAGPAIDPALGLGNLDPARLHEIAVASPDMTALGVATVELIDDLGRTEGLAKKRLVGESAAETLGLVDRKVTGAGVICLGQWGDRPQSQVFAIAESVHAEMEFLAALCSRADRHPRAAELLDFLFGEAAGQVAGARGWLVPPRGK
ncbi:MAG: substrate-binding domain-containing protein [Planctomycetota bacterium]